MTGGRDAERDVLTTLGVDDPGRLVGVRAGELHEWGWLVGRLVGWLDQAADATAHDLNRYFAGSPNREGMACFLEYISERIGALLDGDRGQP